MSQHNAAHNDSDHHHGRRHHHHGRRRRFFRPLMLVLGLFLLFNVARTTGYHAGWQEGYFFAQVAADGATPAMAYGPAAYGHHGGWGGHGFGVLGILGAIFKIWLFFLIFGTMAKLFFFGRRRRWAGGHGHYGGGWHRGGSGRDKWSGPKPPWWQADHPDRGSDDSDDDDPIPPHKANVL